MKHASDLAEAPVSAVGIRWLRISVIYFVIGVSLGIAMGMTENFVLRPVHAHLNLLGWATLALAGLIYHLFPAAGESRLGRMHFWLHNTGLPIMMASLALLLTGHTGAIPVLVAGEMLAFAGVIVFATNVFANVGRAESEVAVPIGQRRDAATHEGV